MLSGFSQFCAYLESVSGMVISEDKRYLVESRILPIVRRERLAGLTQLLTELQKSRTLRDEVIHAMTINETYFFRDKYPFELFADKILTKLHLVRSPGETLRIWSAACSTGQEPYSLAMVVEERKALLQGRKVEIVATDVSEPVLNKAREGLYSAFEVQRGLATERLQRHFTACEQGWRIKPEIKNRVSFKPLNLLGDYSSIGTFDVILCGNVLIYFNARQKTDILAKLGRRLKSGGYLMLGASESTMGSAVPLVPDSDFKGCYTWAEHKMTNVAEVSTRVARPT